VNDLRVDQEGPPRPELSAHLREDLHPRVDLVVSGAR
jgi:hypothetical protein